MRRTRIALALVLCAAMGAAVPGGGTGRQAGERTVTAPRTPTLTLKEVGRQYQLEWGSTDYDVRYSVRRIRRTYPSRKFDPPVVVANAVTTQTAEYPSPSLTVSCYSVQAIDEAGTTSNWSAYRCGDMVAPGATMRWVRPRTGTKTVRASWSGRDNAAGVYGFLPQYRMRRDGTCCLSAARTLSMGRTSIRLLQVPRKRALYCVSVKAVDLNGNVSSLSPMVCKRLGA